MHSHTVQPLAIARYGRTSSSSKWRKKILFLYTIIFYFEIPSKQWLQAFLNSLIIIIIIKLCRHSQLTEESWRIQTTRERLALTHSLTHTHSHSLESLTHSLTHGLHQLTNSHSVRSRKSRTTHELTEVTNNSRTHELTNLTEVTNSRTH